MNEQINKNKLSQGNLLNMHGEMNRVVLLSRLFEIRTPDIWVNTCFIDTIKVITDLFVINIYSVSMSIHVYRYIGKARDFKNHVTPAEFLFGMTSTSV